MSDRTPNERDSQIVSESAAAHLLARASELDAARHTGVEVGDLRTAAAEAGISPAAFEAALAELDRGGTAQRAVAQKSGATQWGRWLWNLGALTLVAMFVFWLVVRTEGVPANPAPMLKGEFLLRCITPGDAAQLIRPMLDLPGNRVSTSAADRPGVLSVEATPEQMQRVRAVLDQHENSLTGICVSGRTNG